MNAKTSILATAALAVTLIATSPAALADNHGKQKQGSNDDRQEMCDNYREGKGRFNREERREERQQAMEQNRIEMADRLKLNQDQREILKEIHLERQQEMEQRMDKWEEKMQQRCDRKGKNGKNGM